MDLLSQTMQERARVKIERALSFSGGSAEMDGHMLPKKMRTPRDQMSHRIIEKRRRDRMNNCLANLGQLIPVNYLKQGQGRIEKTEIIEMATQHIQQLQTQVQAMSSMERPCCQEKFLMGYKECRDEVMRFLVEMSGYEAADPFCLTLLKHLHNQSKKFVPESASSVYHQSTQSPHHGGASDYTMAQNAGEVGGLMRLSKHPEADHLSPLPSSKPSSVPSVVVNSNSNSGWNNVSGDGSNGSPPQKNIYTDVNQYLQQGDPRHTSCSPLCSDSGYSTPSVPYSKTHQSPYIRLRESSDKSSGIGSGNNSGSASSPETTQPELEGCNGNNGTGAGSNNSSNANSPSASRPTSQQAGAYKFKNDIKQRFTKLTGSFDKPTNDSEASYSNSVMESPSSKSMSSPDSAEKSVFGGQIRRESDVSVNTLPLLSVNTSNSTDTSPTDSMNSWQQKHGSSVHPKKSKLSTMSQMSMEENDNNGKSGDDMVPAFALHPMGTCYIPLVISTSIMEPFLLSHSAPLNICHPVSIPVNFNRPDPHVLLAKPEGGCRSQQQKIEPMAVSGGLKRSHDSRDS